MTLRNSPGAPRVVDTIFRTSRGSSAHLQEEHWIPLSDLMTGRLRPGLRQRHVEKISLFRRFTFPFTGGMTFNPNFFDDLLVFLRNEDPHIAREAASTRRSIVWANLLGRCSN